MLCDDFSKGERGMKNGRTVLRVLIAAAVVAGVAAWQFSAEPERAAAGQKKAEPVEKKGGTVVGTLTAKDDSPTKAYIEVKADGEAKARKYTPHWVGGAPAQGGGFDKKTVAAIKAVKVGSRVRVEWDFQERPRVVRLEVLKAANLEKK
jgi:hypothetical protein